VSVMTYEEALRIARERLPNEPKEDSLERWARNMPKPEPPRQQRSLDIPHVDLDERVNTLIAAERDFIIEVVGQALGEFRDELVGDIEKMIAKEVEKLRAEVNLKRASEGGDVVLLPNPFLRRAERG
jgi:hypothetical protein